VITPSSGLLDNLESATRNPIANLRVSWGNILLSGEWFRLDQSTLDGNCLLTIKPYLFGETIEEYINEIDGYKYDDESPYIKMLEGYTELIGDNYQYSISDFDCELINTNNRFTPRQNKNLLPNPGLENSLDYWNITTSGLTEIKIDENKMIHGIRSAYFRGPVEEDGYATIYSDRFSINKEMGILIEENFSYSQYLMGSGLAYLDLRAYSNDNISSQSLTEGLIGRKTVQSTLVSGEWCRCSMNYLVPSGTVFLRTAISLSGAWMNVDSGQIEKGLTITDYDANFIGDLILPKRVIKVEVGMGNAIVPKFSGLVDRLVPNLKDDTITMHAYDWADKIKDTKITAQLYQGKRSDELIAILADQAGINNEKRNLEIGMHLVAYAYFPEASAWTYMNQIAEAEGGRIFFDEEGTLTFWNRNHVSAQASQSVYTFDFDTNILNFDYDISKSKVKNRIVVKANPKELLSRTRIYNDNAGQQLNVDETNEIWAQFAHGTESPVPAIEVEIPIVGIGIKANSQMDGLGTDLSAYVEMTSYSLFSESLKMNFKNNYNDIVYLTHIAVYGQPIVTQAIIEVIKEDMESQRLYDVQELQIENNFIDMETYAENLAVQKLEELKSPRNFVRAEVIGAPHLQAGDIVTMQEGFDGQMDSYTIVKDRWQLQGDFIQNLKLEKKVILTWFVLDVSLLDSPDKLYT
jgi:hypothetical protein